MLLHSARTHSASPPPIDSDRDDWWRLARCAQPGDRDMWTANDQGVRLAAAHQCVAHCPVLARCHAEAQGHTWPGTAIGGVVHGYDGLPLDVEPPRHCDTCRPPVAAPAGPFARLALCERCGREFTATHPSRRQCRTPECERGRWRESRARGRMSTGVVESAAARGKAGDGLSSGLSTVPSTGSESA